MCLLFFYGIHFNKNFMYWQILGWIIYQNIKLNKNIKALMQMNNVVKFKF